MSAPVPPSFVNKDEAQSEDTDLPETAQEEPAPFEETAILSAPVPPSFVNKDEAQSEGADLPETTQEEPAPFEETAILSAPVPPSFVNKDEAQSEDTDLPETAQEEPAPFEETAILSAPVPPSFVNKDGAQSEERENNSMLSDNLQMSANSNDALAFNDKENQELFSREASSGPWETSSDAQEASSEERETSTEERGTSAEAQEVSSASQETSAEKDKKSDSSSENKSKKTFFATLFSGKDKKEDTPKTASINQKTSVSESEKTSDKAEKSKEQSDSSQSKPLSLDSSGATTESLSKIKQASENAPQEAGKDSEPSKDVHSEQKAESLSSLVTTPPTASPQTQKANYTSPTFLKDLFANGNECITAPSGSFPVKEDTRLLLALFSNGRFFVSETYKFDGKVLGFEYLAKKRRLQIGKPEYIPMVVLSNIYEYAANTRSSYVEQNEEDQEQARMQRDFVTIISRAAANKVSDIHIVVADHTTVMFRVNGLMQTEMEYNKEWGESFVRAAFASSDISDSNYAQNEYQAAQKLGRTPLRGSHGKLVLPHNVLGIRLQFNPIAFGSRYVIMRLLYASDDVTSAGNVEVLGFTKKQAETFYRLRGIPTGMIVISGPTGSGKSTTLQRNMIAMLQERNYEINLITVEDPPEYPIPGARQMPVTNASIEEAKDREFTKALSAALRSDPDSLMIGEIRTLSAADLAFRGALSGHNVWTTLHANSAPAVLMRLKDMGVEDFKLQDPEIMKGMLAQRLFRKVCPYCRVPASTRLDHPAVQRLREAFGDVGLEYAYLRGPGCKHCDFRGVIGRTVVAEFVIPDGTFLDLMLKGESKKALNYWINDLNGQTLREAAQERMLEGIIDIEEVERWTGFLNQIIV